jgi:hypothetical protein
MFEDCKKKFEKKIEKKIYFISIIIPVINIKKDNLETNKKQRKFSNSIIIKTICMQFL